MCISWRIVGLQRIFPSNLKSVLAAKYAHVRKTNLSEKLLRNWNAALKVFIYPKLYIFLPNYYT